MATHYRSYLDESSNPDMTQRSIRHFPYFGLCGCFIEQSYYRERFIGGIAELKRRFWGDDPDARVIFHREDIVARSGPFEILKDSETRDRFNRMITDMYSRASYRLVTVAIDKAYHVETYDEPKHVYHYCVEAMLERFIMFLRESNAFGSVMAESRGDAEDEALNDAWNTLVDGGTGNISRQQIYYRLDSRKLEVRKKDHNIAGLQLADLLANPTTQDVLVAYGVKERFKENFTPHVCRAVADKYRCSSTRQVNGYGRVFLGQKVRS
jgi:hypothetical protein